MGMGQGIAGAAAMLLGVFLLQAGQFQEGKAALDSEWGTESGATGGATGGAINLYEETGIELDREREAEAFLIEGLFPACNYDLLSYSVIWREEFSDYGEGLVGQTMFLDYRAGRRRQQAEELDIFQKMLDRVGITDIEGLDWNEATLAAAILEQNAGMEEEEAKVLAGSFMQAYWRLNGPVPLGEKEFLIVWDEEGSGFVPYLYPGDGGIETPYTYDNSFWSATDVGDSAQGAPMTLRDLNTYQLDRLFIELNNEDIGAYWINDYSVTNRYWTDKVIGTDIVFHVTPQAERAEDLEYFQGILARAGLTDIEKIKELMKDLELPGEDEWRSVPHPEDTVVEGIIPATSEPSPRMEAVIVELAEMLTENGHSAEDAERIAHTLMFRYYPLCAEWLASEQEYSFCFRTDFNEDGAPVSMMVDRTGGACWTDYTPHLKTKEEQREVYFQAGYDEMDGMMYVMGIM